MARLASLLRGLARIDAWIAGLESALLCALLLALVAGGFAQVLAQNVGLAASGGFRLGLLAAGLGLLSLGAASALASRRGGGAARGRGSRGMLAGAFLLLVAGAFALSNGLDALMRASVLWIGLLGASLATRWRRHITIEALEKVVPASWKRPAAAAVHLAAGGLLLALLAVSLEYVGESRARADALFVHRGTGFAFPTWWAKLILPLGLATMAWRFGLLFGAALLGRDLLPRESALPGAGPEEEAGLAAP
ncbi:MAG: TRAP transporter small permease subunit [Planctomycetes bacterium]|nr:TRAP transporter small permease subunit [Planctomycetota bacterium]